jgi:O-antigen/teichoic acid export membrane protein
LFARLRAFVGSLDQTLIRGSAAAFGVSVAAMALGFVIQVLLARTLGAKEYGLYLYIVGWANVAGLLCALEFSVAGTRYVSAYAASEEWGMLRGFLRRSHQIVVGISFSVAAIGIVAAVTLSGLFPVAAPEIIAAGVLFPFTALAQLHTGLLQGLKRVIHAQVPFQVVRPVLFGGMVAVVVFAIGKKISAPGAIAAQVIATGASVVITSVLLHRDIPAESRGVHPVYRTREWLTTSAHFIAISVAQLILSAQTDVLVVGTFLGTAQAGPYGAASQFSSLVGFGSAAIMVIAMPMIAELYARGRLADLRRISRQIIRLSLMVSVPVFLALAVLGYWLLGLYGEAFVAAYPVLLLLSLSQLIAASVGMLVGYLLTMTDHQKVASKIIGATAILNLVLTLLLTPRFGVMGTASATLVATLARSVVLLIAVRRLLGSAATPAEALG